MSKRPTAKTLHTERHHCLSFVPRILHAVCLKAIKDLEELLAP
jgi:hypothetical protein